MRTQPYAHYDEVYVIIRSDPSVTGEQSPEAVVSLVKALWTHTEAETGAARLERRVAAI
jgi:hypothetical protein